ncbi:MAG: response regulator, partial [Pseudomonadales bacterium]
MIDYVDVQVLLVEDTVEDAELMLRTLRKSGLANDLHHVQDGAEALEFLLGSGRPKSVPMPKLVLLDLKLPKVNGLEVLRQLRAQEATLRVPVVMITSSREDSDIEEAYRLG